MQMFPGQELIIIFQIFYKIKSPHLNLHSSFLMLENFAEDKQVKSSSQSKNLLNTVILLLLSCFIFLFLVLVFLI